MSADGQDNVKVQRPDPCSLHACIALHECSALTRHMNSNVSVALLIHLADSARNSTHCLQIFVRVRPFNHAEQDGGTHSALTIRSNSHLSLLPHSEASQYVFDCIFSGGSTQETMFEGVLPHHFELKFSASCSCWPSCLPFHTRKMQCTAVEHSRTACISTALNTPRQTYFACRSRQSRGGQLLPRIQLMRVRVWPDRQRQDIHNAG